MGSESCASTLADGSVPSSNMSRNSESQLHHEASFCLVDLLIKSKKYIANLFSMFQHLGYVPPSSPPLFNETQESFRRYTTLSGLSFPIAKFVAPFQLQLEALIDDLWSPEANASSSHDCQCCRCRCGFWHPLLVVYRSLSRLVSVVSCV